ncbi:integrase core domain-containing protein, partial [Veronia pacifica]
IISAWRLDYNENRPHSALGYLTPSEFAATIRTQGKEHNQTDVTKDRLD